MFEFFFQPNALSLSFQAVSFLDTPNNSYISITKGEKKSLDLRLHYGSTSDKYNRFDNGSSV